MHHLAVALRCVPNAVRNMTATFTFTVCSWCLSVPAFLSSWRFGASALAADSKDTNTDHEDVPVSKSVYAVGKPCSDGLGAHKLLERNSVSGD